MKTNTFLIALVLAVVNPPLHAGQVPDIVWRTNAHNGYGLYGVVFAPDSKSVFSCSTDARRWRVSDLSLLRAYAIPRNDVGAIAVSPDGRLLMGRGGNRGLYLWRVLDGTVLYSSDPSGGSSLCFSPNGNSAAAGSRESISILTLEGDSLTGGITYSDIHSDDVTALAFSPDGSLLLSGSYDSTAKLVRVSDGTVVKTFAHLLYVNCVAFSPNGRTIATGAAIGDVRLWSTNGTLRHALPVAGNTTRAMDFSPDGQVLVTASGGLVQFWRVADGAHLVTYGPDPRGPVAAVDVSPDGKLFAYGCSELVLARMPTLVTRVERQAEEFRFDWQGGSGLYQVQTTSNVVQGPWVNLGPPTTNTSLTVPTTNPAAFFRLQSLTNAP